MAMISKRGPIFITEKEYEQVIENNDMLKDYFDYQVSYFNIMDRQ